MKLGEMTTDVVVIGAGQAGLSATFHLQRRGIDHITLDAAEEPGGAWLERWDTLTVDRVNGIFGLPLFHPPELDPQEKASVAVPAYFADFERAAGLNVIRPARVLSVRRSGDEFVVDSTVGRVRAKAVINATGTWDTPLRADYPGQSSFAGRQIHTRDYTGPDEFAGMRVGIVGAGISALQHLDEISRVAETFWYTRREPDFRDHFDGREVERRVAENVERGEPARSVVSYTGLFAGADYVAAARERGALNRRDMFREIVPEGVVEADGTLTRLNALVWATGFRPSLSHLEPLGLVNDRGGIAVDGTQVVAEPMVHLIGFGPSQSTVGANRAGREAAVKLRRALENVT
ncbi:Predicted flavoprotein CzcO associated with the cation diffusion facilitator CzcD [Corynebacterium mycetoides]|uniref:Predicted flavoprotein CzcO associated with the cation diffusion facilitator CzcD n=1 Tax=Corynebacterium mycetoides TaxID=38302 RepID=A0A1G9LP29_9CORY|nr:NAD(P)/FAD-dependent oxidoreductase [Corynebacterium mycetoides]SDL63584.1 Predicted flavoprotein CzcO associated with the cation diffusion facilitator CzcD [Corynebacterium mycetoides]